MSNLEEFLNNKLPEDQDDRFMEKITKHRMDGKKRDYEQKLKSTYGVAKGNYKENADYKKLALIIAGIAILIAGIYFLLSTLGMPDHQADFSKSIAAYIDANKIHNYDIVRGASVDAAYTAYQKEEYDRAIDLWGKSEINLQDSFYLSLAYLYNQEYEAAASIFDALNDKLATNDKFYPEQQLYWALALIMKGDQKHADDVYESWSSESWMAVEYRKIMEEGK